MKRLGLFVTFCVIALAGISFGQGETPPLFVFERQIGQLRPSGIQYEPVFDRFVWVDLSGQLVLVDAPTYTVQHVLYTSGVYNAYTFSHDGRHLALAIDRRIELWDTRTGTLAETFEPTGVLQTNGPLTFSMDDGLLLVNSLVPAPPELRRSENDTSNLPWLWDVADALDEADPSLPRRAENVPFFDFRNGLIIGPNRTLIGGYPSRLVVIGGTSEDWHVKAEISSSRAEQDPIYVWQSATDDFLYVDPRRNTFTQVDTRDTRKNTVVELPLGRDLGFKSARRLAFPVQFSRSAQLIGASNHVYPTSLGSLIYGENYTDGANGRTLMLLDILQPLTVSADQTALLVYNYSERDGRGVMELVRLDGMRVLITPDSQRLVVRRGGAQVEIYDIASGVLERTIYPAEPDDGTQTFALTADGKTLVVDFQRFDVLTGAMTAHATPYTQGSDNLFYTDDGSALVTQRGSELTFRDVESGEVKGTARIEITGSVLATSRDSLRYLLFRQGDSTLSFEIYDVRTNERRSTTFSIDSSFITQIIPRADWQQFLISYGSGEVAVYDFDGNRLMSFPADELPDDNGRQLGWIDDYSVYVASNSPSMPPPRQYGYDYHASGVPACLVAEYPDDWPLFVTVWDNLNLRLSFSQLNDLTRRLCAKLPEQAATVVPGLTPTPRFSYNGLEGVRVQGALPDVPLCLTRAFPSEQLQYAALWRQLSEGLDEAAKAELADLLCEGLITSLGQIAATATVNPNLLSAGEPTAIPDAPESVSRREFGLTVVTIDIATAQRQLGTYIPDVQFVPQRDLRIIANLYAAQFNRQPGRFALSPDGTRMAMLNDNGFIELYRLTRSYAELAADEVSIQATRIASRPRDIGLPPTPTPGFVSIGGSLPTITPTITPTMPAPKTVDITPVTQDICPARALYSLENLPPDYAASGRIITASPTGDWDVTWVFEPESGYWRAVEGFPPCGTSENCTFSADNAWILRQNETGGVVVSRPDGTDATTLFRGGVEDFPAQGYQFVNQHTVEYNFEAWLPEKYSSPVQLFGRFDPDTGATTEPAERLRRETLQIAELPTTEESQQPMEGPLHLLTTPYRSASGGNGLRYYIYDTRDDTYEYFLRLEGETLWYEWEARGTALYYAAPDRSGFYIYDTATKTHRRIERYGIPNGALSNDLRYTAYALSPEEDTYDDRLAAGELPLKLAVWDSETLTTRRYCLPETGADYFNPSLIWSPDGRYLVFQIQPRPPGADHFPTPVGEETPQPPTATPVPLDVQYDLQFIRTVILDTQTGYVTVLSKDIGLVTQWVEDAR